MLTFFAMYLNPKAMPVVIKSWARRLNHWGGLGAAWNAGIAGCATGLALSPPGMCYSTMLVGYFTRGCIHFNSRTIWILMFNTKRAGNLWDATECKFTKRTIQFPFLSSMCFSLLFVSGSPQALAQSCLSFGAFSFVLEYMNHTRPAIAATVTSVLQPSSSRQFNIINHHHWHLNMPALPPFTLPPLSFPSQLSFLNLESAKRTRPLWFVYYQLVVVLNFLFSMNKAFMSTSVSLHLLFLRFQNANIKYSKVQF